MTDNNEGRAMTGREAVDVKWAESLRHHAAHPDPISMHCAIPARIIEQAADYLAALEAQLAAAPSPEPVAWEYTLRYKSGREETKITNDADAMEYYRHSSLFVGERPLMYADTPTPPPVAPGARLTDQPASFAGLAMDVLACIPADWNPNQAREWGKLGPILAEFIDDLREGRYPPSPVAPGAVTEAMVEAAAQALAKANFVTWAQSGPALRAALRDDARAVLTAALTAPRADAAAREGDGQPVEMCESGCGPATTTDGEGVPLCDACKVSLERETLHEIAKLVGYDPERHDDAVEAVRERLAGAREEAVIVAAAERWASADECGNRLAEVVAIRELREAVSAKRNAARRAGEEQG